MLAGNATDVVLDADSGVPLNPDVRSRSDGQSPDCLCRLCRDGDTGVFMSPNQGQVWNLMAGNVGNPLIIDTLTGKNVNPDESPNPTAAEGRIVLSVPAPTGNAVENAIYAGWLYAAVATPSGGYDGLFMTKDFGQNWVEVNIATMPPAANFNQAIPTNDVTQPNYAITLLNQGNLYLTLSDRSD